MLPNLYNAIFHVFNIPDMQFSTKLKKKFYGIQQIFKL